MQIQANPEGPRDGWIHTLAVEHREVKIVIRSCRLGWRWRLMDYLELVDSGVKKRWIDAQQEAMEARKAYALRLNGDGHAEKTS